MNSEKLTFGVIGLGNIGGFYGAKLQNAGYSVTFFEEYHYKAIEKEKVLSVKSPQGDFQVEPIHLTNDLAQMPKCDYVLLTLKSPQLDNSSILSQLPSFLKPNGAVLVMQNGFGTEEKIEKYIKPSQIITAVPFIIVQRTSPNRIMHLDYGLISLADYTVSNEPAGISPRLEKLASILKSADIECSLEEDYQTVRWQKLLWYIPFNALAVVLNANSKQLLTNANSCTMINELMLEIVAAAKSQGRDISEELVNQWMRSTQHMEPYPTSMKTDFDLKRPLEIESLIKEPIRRAKSQGVTLPKMEFLYSQLKFIEEHSLAFGQLV